MNDTTRTQRVNEYDSSVWYSDMILGKLLEELEKLDRPAYLIYFSDHGSVCEQTGLRTPGSVENSAYEIPFLIWTNRHYRKQVPELVERMMLRRQVPLQADRAHFGLLEMMGISFKKDIEKWNFLSGKYIQPPRFVREGEEPYRREQ
jgi:heptose-I-phosphate ethanolaminephosphotransferase